MFIGCFANGHRWVFPMDRIIIEKDITGFVNDPKEYVIRNIHSSNEIIRFEISAKKHFVLLKNEEEVFEWLNK